MQLPVKESYTPKLAFIISFGICFSQRRQHSKKKVKFKKEEKQ
jgi:hypothetical protein